MYEGGFVTDYGHDPELLMYAEAVAEEDWATVDYLERECLGIAEDHYLVLVHRLQTCAAAGDAQAVEECLAAGMDPNAADEDGLRAIHVAALMDRIDVVRVLLEHSADPNVRDRQGETALHWCCQAHRSAQGEAAVRLFASPVMLDMLVTAGARVDAPDDYLYTAFHVAAEAGNYGAVDWLLESGVDPGGRTAFGDTALHLAAAANNPAMADRLVEVGGDVNLKDVLGWTPFGMAEEFGSEAAAAALRELGGAL